MQLGIGPKSSLILSRSTPAAYSIIMNRQKAIKEHLYIDAFAGAGQHISRKSGDFVAGSPLNALLIKPLFSEFHLIDLDGNRAAELQRLIGPRKDVFIHEGDANDILLNRIFSRCRWEDFRRALCLLDPYALTVDWKVLETAAKMRSVEVFYNFMIMDANMNVLWRDPERVTAVQAARMDKVWGDGSWRQAAYRKERGLFEEIEEKADNETIADAFRGRLKEVAGFSYVPKPLPMRNERGAVIYYLFFASHNKTGGHIVEDIFNKYRSRGMR